MIKARDEFLDTNILVYAFTEDHRTPTAEGLVRSGCAISVQSLNEFAHVAIRKLQLTWPETNKVLFAIRTLCPRIFPLAMTTHLDAMRLAERYKLRMYDALLVAAALENGCRVFWSEDMHDGLVIDGRLRIANPFTATPLS